MVISRPSETRSANDFIHIFGRDVGNINFALLQTHNPLPYKVSSHFNWVSTLSENQLFDILRTTFVSYDSATELTSRPAGLPAR